MEDLIGQTLLNRYKVDEFIGRGGMAEVYRAYDTRRRIPVALKFLRDDLAEDEIFLRRFRREAKVLETLQHPNIVRYYGFEEGEGFHFLVVEFIQGEGLRKKLTHLTHPLTFRQALYIMEPVCNALHYAHAEGIYHCDVKPANVMVDNAGRVVVADFGIARLAESATMTVGAVGTPAYMSPEQCRSQKVDARTDVYALAITLFEMLTLERPFTGAACPKEGSISERVRWEQMKLPPPSLRKYNREVPKWADEAFQKALQKQKSKRFKSVLALYLALTNNGRVTPDPMMPWAGAETDLAGATQVEPIAPNGSTRGGRYERRVNDAAWAVRRSLSSVSQWTSRTRQTTAALWQLHAGKRLDAVRQRVADLWNSARGRLFRTWSQMRKQKAVWVSAGGLVIIAVALIVAAGSGAFSTRPQTSAVPPLAPTVTPRPTSTATLQPARTPQPSPTVAASSSVLIVSTVANIRTGPSTLYPVLGVAKHGDSLEVVARSATGPWYEVCCMYGKVGWVHGDLVEVTGEIASIPAITATPPPAAPIGPMH